jgi:hypothetical protein
MSSLIHAKIEINPEGFTLGIKAGKKKHFTLPQLTNKCWTLWPRVGPKVGKRIPSKLGGQFATHGANISL